MSDGLRAETWFGLTPCIAGLSIASFYARVIFQQTELP